LYPFYDNITYQNITATGTTGNIAIIYGLNSQDANPLDPARNIDSILFDNVNLSGTYGADIYYVSNLNVTGLHTTATSGPSRTLVGDATVVPEPGSAGVVAMTVIGFYICRRRISRPAICK